MIERICGHVQLFAFCVLFAFLCVTVCVIVGCVHILGASAVAVIAGIVGYRSLLIMTDRRLPLDLTPVIDVINNLMAMSATGSAKRGQRVKLVDDRPSSAQQLDHGAEENRFQNERSISGIMYEVDLFVQCIMKDFIVNWYANVSSNEQFLREIQYALEDSSVALVSRVRKLDARALLRKAFHIYHNYFAAYAAALAKVKEKSSCPSARTRKGDPDPRVENFFTDWHFALESGQTEMQHLHNMVNVLLEVLLPADVLSCNLWRKLVVDLLACKVLLPLVNLLSDPIYLNQKITALVVDSSRGTTDVTLRDSCFANQAMSTEATEPQNAAKYAHSLGTDVSRIESWEDRTLLDSYNSLNDDAPPNAQVAADSTLFFAKESPTTPDLVGNAKSFFEDEKYCSDDVTDGIWQRMADESPSTFWCEREQEVNHMMQEASASLELKKRPLKLPLSGSIDKISDLFSGTISFDAISNNIAQYFKSSSEEDKSSLNTQVSVEGYRQMSADGSAEDYAPYESAGHQTGSDSKVIYRSNEDEQRSELTSPEFHVKSVLERLFHMTTGPVLSEHAFSITSTVIDKDGEEKRNSPPLSVSESVESSVFYASKNIESKCLQETPWLDSTDNLKVCHAGSLKTPTEYQARDVALFTTTFSNLHISGTEVIDDANSGSYVVYCITYEVHFQNNDVIDAAESENYLSSVELQALSKSCFVRRRFREFVTLQSRLEDDPKLRALMKGIKGPNKWTMLPFNKLDKEAIAERKQVLKHYLQTLLAKDDIASSVHFKEFLAYGNDPSIAYVRKAADVGLPVPRIDKFLMKTMTGVFDKLKTALPSLPHDLSPVEPFMNTQQKTSERILGFLNFTSGIADENALRINFDFELDKDYQICVEDHLGRFLSLFERNNEPADPAYDVAADIDAWCQHPCLSPSDCEKQNTNVETSLSGAVDTLINDEIIDCYKCIDDDIPLASTIINFTVGTIQNEDMALNREPFVSMTKILFGRILERWMCEFVTKYTCEKMFAKYLRIIRESLWPNGIFGVQATIPPSESDRTRISTETLRGLKSCVPGFIAIILGKAQCDSGMELVFDSFQHPKMLRHFIYHLMDLVVEALLIRSRSQSIIDKLSSLS